MSAIREALIYQKEELKRKLEQRYIQRDASINNIESDIIKVITGPRRAGKSFFAIHALQEIDNFGYANYDDETLAGAENYNEVISEINVLYNNPRYILLDEIQNLDKWELFVNRLHRQGHNLVITGSNSNLLSMELATHLTGRHLTTDLLPLSFKEIATRNNSEVPESEFKALFSDYLVNGGYPEPLVKNLDYAEYLSTLFESVIYKDIVRRYRIRKPRIIEEIATYLIANLSREFSYNKLADMTMLKSPHSVKRYVDFLKEGFIFFEVERYSTKISERVKANRKIYCIDNGFINSKVHGNSRDTGKLYENLVAIEIKRRTLREHLEFFYWKNAQQEEVDFVIKDGTKITKLIQVCSDPRAQVTKSREVRALLKASVDLRCDDLTVLTEDYESEEIVEWFGVSKPVKFIATWRWLLSG